LAASPSARADPAKRPTDRARATADKVANFIIRFLVHKKSSTKGAIQTPIPNIIVHDI
jgi:hypothetical protein